MSKQPHPIRHNGAIDALRATIGILEDAGSDADASFLAYTERMVAAKARLAAPSPQRHSNAWVAARCAQADEELMALVARARALIAQLAAEAA